MKYKALKFHVTSLQCRKRNRRSLEKTRKEILHSNCKLGFTVLKFVTLYWTVTVTQFIVITDLDWTVM